MRKGLFSIFLVFICLFLFSNTSHAAGLSSKTLSQGSKGNEVYQLQYTLNKLGYSLNADGVYGPITKQKVAQFQKAQKLTASGTADSKTLMVLNTIIQSKKWSIPSQPSSTGSKDSSKGKTYTDVTSVKKAPTSGYWIVVNKSTNRLTLFKGSDVVKTYPVATGKTSKLTPEGKFTIVMKAVNPSWGGNGKAKPIKGGDPKNPLGKRWMGLSIGGGGQYGIHGNSNPSSIGTYASAGCVRMYNDDVVELYDIVPKKTTVWIGTSSKLSSWGVK